MLRKGTQITENISPAISPHSPLTLFSPRILLRIEGAVLLSISVLLYTRTGSEWWLFALLLLAPDLSALGYLGGNRLGAAAYNLFHTYLLPGALIAYGLISNNTLAVSLALIWFAHIGMDRLIGYGLKYDTAFKETHLGRV